MSDFDQDLKQLLSEEDEAFIMDPIDETGFYTSVLKSFKGPGSGSAQIALKLWYNMQLNRRTITREIKLLQLALAKPSNP